MIKPTLRHPEALFVYDPVQHRDLLHEAESLPSLMLNSAAAANAVMLGGLLQPAEGYMNAATP